MSLPDAKTLKKLVDTCRKVGIKHFKSAEFEFTLTDEPPVSKYKKKQAEQEVSTSFADDEFKGEALNEEQLLFWSAANLNDETVES